MVASLARSLASPIIRIFDGHNDVLLALHEAGGERDGDGLTAADRAFATGGGPTRAPRPGGPPGRPGRRPVRDLPRRPTGRRRLRAAGGAAAGARRHAGDDRAPAPA